MFYVMLLLNNIIIQRFLRSQLFFKSLVFTTKICLTSFEDKLILNI
jgi:hypothetical protein